MSISNAPEHAVPRSSDDELTSRTRIRNSNSDTSRRRSRFRAAPYFFILPFFVIFAGFVLYPIVYTFILSLSKWTAGNTSFIGLDNYRHLFADTLFWKALGNTAIFLLIQVPSMLFLAVVLAAVLNSKAVPFRGTLRTLFFLPALVDLVTYSIVFSMLFNESDGVINSLLSIFKLDAIPWRTDPTWAKVMIIIVITWRWLGYNAIIILSGLQSIPGDIYEAAKIDGANVVQTFTRITVPMVKPILLFCALLSTIGTLQLFAEPYILTGGGPNNATSTVMTYLYEKGFSSFNFGLASAGSYVVTMLIAILAYLQIKATKGGEV